MLRDKLIIAKKVFQIINHDLDRLVEAKNIEKEDLYLKLKGVNEELCDSVIELIKQAHLNKKKKPNE
jgi:hypothetical protein